MDEAFSAGVEPGGLYNSQEIKILICYMLYSVNQPMLRDDVLDIILTGGMANYFDTEDAISELLRLQHLIEDDEQHIATTVTGRQIGETLATRVPYTLRERSVQAALELLRRRRIEKDNTFTLRKLADGSYEAVCAVENSGKALLSVALNLADEHQAGQIKEQFLNDPATLYRAVLAVLTGDVTATRDGNRIIITLQ